MSLDDIGIVKQVLSGDREKFAIIVEKHQKSLLRLCLRFAKSPDLAEDIVQETFIKAFKKLHMFEGRSAFKSWLFQIAMNTAKNKLRSQRDHISFDNVQISSNGQLDRDIMQENLKTMIKDIIESLPKKQKMALSLRIYDDLSFKEIAEIMECPYDTAKANYRHAIISIKKGLKTQELMDHWSALETPISIDITSTLKSS